MVVMVNAVMVVGWLVAIAAAVAVANAAAGPDPFPALHAPAH